IRMDFGGHALPQSLLKGGLLLGECRRARNGRQEDKTLHRTDLRRLSILSVATIARRAAYVVRMVRLPPTKSSSSLSTACPRCPLKSRCTTGGERRISR